MDRLTSDQLAEIAGVLSDDDAILGQTTGEHGCVVLATTANVKRVDCIMLAAVIQADRNLR
jgi:hypothetical protein